MLAIPLAMLNWLIQASRIPTPAEWARRESEMYLERAKVDRERHEWKYAEDDEIHARQLLEIAGAFEADRAISEERSYYSAAPFNSLLATGDAMMVRQDNVARIDDANSVGTTERKRVPISKGTKCVVMKDYAGDKDDCHFDRPIQVEIVEGPLRGVTAQVQRIYLRRTR